MKRWRLRLTVLAALVAPTIVILALPPSHRGAPPPVAQAQQQGLVEMSLSVLPAANLNCLPEENPSGTSDKCFVDQGAQFTLSVNINAVPVSGYVSYQVDVVHTGLISKAVRHVAPAQFPIQAPTQGVGTDGFLAGALTGNQPPLPVSNYTGPIVEADLDCAAVPGTFKISLQVLGTVGTLVVNSNNEPIPITTIEQDIDGDTTLDKAAATLLINCGDRLAFDVDGDGCTSARELGPDPRLGGLRDPKNPWDFYDTNGDKTIDLFNDILGVIVNWQGSDPAYDRGPTVGPYAWNMTAPDGIINLFNDILGVIGQWSHDCRAAP